MALKGQSSSHVTHTSSRSGTHDNLAPAPVANETVTGLELGQSRNLKVDTTTSVAIMEMAPTELKIQTYIYEQNGIQEVINCDEPGCGRTFSDKTSYK
jgi:hypothetical protein